MPYITAFISNLSKGVVLGAQAAILALLAFAPASGVVGNSDYPDIWSFGQVGVAFDAGQAVRVNVANIWDPNLDPAPAHCVAQVQFFEGTSGVLFKRAVLSVPSSETQSADLGARELILLRGKVPIYAQVTIDSGPNPTRGRSAMPLASCRPSLEIFDKVSGRTAVASYPPDPTGALPFGIRQYPDIWSFPALTVALGQVMRLNVLNFKPPIVMPNAGLSECTVLLTIFAADGSQLGQARAVLASGRGTFLDVFYPDIWSFPGLMVPVGEPVVGSGRDRLLCRDLVFSVEVYDAERGIDMVLQSAPHLWVGR